MKAFGILFLVLLGQAAFGAIKINDFKFITEQSNGNLRIQYQGELNDYPDLKIEDNQIKVIIPDSSVARKFSKKVVFASMNNDTEIFLDTLKANTSIVTVNLPFNIKNAEHRVSVLIKDNSIVVNMPKLAVDKKYLQPAKVAPVVSATKRAKPTVRPKAQAQAPVAKEILNEGFLKELEKDQAKKNFNDSKVVAKSGDKKFSFSDMRSSKSEQKRGFSLVEYGAKFAAFLGVVLLLFYGLVTLFKKGFIKRGKLGFLQKTDQVQVISQTYIAPKKSLMLIKAHNQVFLVSNTESGISLVSEIADTTGLLKDAEKEASGSNFDDSVVTAQSNEKATMNVKLKEDIAQSNNRASLSDYLNVKEKVKFSDQIKKKVKNLKPLQ